MGKEERKRLTVYRIGRPDRSGQLGVRIAARYVLQVRTDNNNMSTKRNEWF
jgi:hypothetical protein